MAFKGMNPDEGREVASFVRDTGNKINESANAVKGIVDGLEWVGPDADSFKEEFNAFVSQAVASLVDAYSSQSDILNADADEQEQTSAQ
ncbi:MAG: hypothetical protein Q4G40_04840 [Brachybacterium sp.]|nr:hypothetical protein [Brachybacterium sp.]